MTKWNGKRVLILGGARQGQAAARYLARHGAVVTINDRRPADEMKTTCSALGDVAVTWVLGDHPLALLDATDCVCLSGGIPLTLPIVVEAIRRGIHLTNDTQLFLEACPGRTVGITGSAGKTTTTTLVGRIAQKGIPAGSKKVYTGGNIGDPLLNHVDEMSSDDLAVLEISSFQLEQMTLAPTMAAILNITPNHLDRHGTMQAYIAAKVRILEYQNPEDIAILGRDDPVAAGLKGRVKGRLLTFGLTPLPAGDFGTFSDAGRYLLRSEQGDVLLFDETCVHLRGDHNRQNILAASAIASAVGISAEVIRAEVNAFHGVAHRLEHVRKLRGADWYNDSIATAPERTIAAIRSFTEPLVLLLGGRDKNLPWEHLAAIVHERIDHVVVFGEAAEKILIALGKPSPNRRPHSLVRCDGLREAVQAAADVATEGDIVLLSPGGTSFDQFQDFEQRGEEFRKWVSELT